jgi:hypothetical protein
MLNLGGYYQPQPYISRPGSAPQAVPNVPSPQPAAPYAGATGHRVASYNLGPPGGYGGGTDAAYNPFAQAQAQANYNKINYGTPNTLIGQPVGGPNQYVIDQAGGGNRQPVADQAVRGNLGTGFQPLGGQLPPNQAVRAFGVGNSSGQGSQRAQAVMQLLQRFGMGRPQGQQPRPQANGFAAPNAQQRAYAEQMRLRYPGMTINW